MEVLIATTILAVGVVASLRVFSGALSASNRSMKTRQVHQILNEQLFGWFLDPTTFDPGAVNVLPQSAEKVKLTSQVSIQKLQPAAEEEVKKDKKTPGASRPGSAVAKDVEFYEANLRVSDLKQKPLFEHLFYLSQYGKKKKS